MSFAPFHDWFPDLAKRETRTITVTPAAKFNVPVDEYAFVEMFCDEPDCDCRRVMFFVISSKTQRTEAVIAWGWEDLKYYEKWLGGMDRDMAKEMQGPALNLGSPQSENAAVLLELTRHVLLADHAYVERVKKHYALVRSKMAVASKLSAFARRKSRKGESRKKKR